MRPDSAPVTVLPPSFWMIVVTRTPRFISRQQNNHVRTHGLKLLLRAVAGLILKGSLQNIHVRTPGVRLMLIDFALVTLHHPSRVSTSCVLHQTIATPVSITGKRKNGISAMVVPKTCFMADKPIRTMAIGWSRKAAYRSILFMIAGWLVKISRGTALNATHCAWAMALAT